MRKCLMRLRRLIRMKVHTDKVLRVTLRISDPELIAFLEERKKESIVISDFFRLAVKEVMATGRWKEWK